MLGTAAAAVVVVAVVVVVAGESHFRYKANRLASAATRLTCSGESRAVCECHQRKLLADCAESA